MAVKIRLARIGTKNLPFYRIVAIDQRKKRDGEFLEDLGSYNPRSNELIHFKKDRLDAWVAQGALPTDVVKKLCKMYKKSSSVAAKS